MEKRNKVNCNRGTGPRREKNKEKEKKSKVFSPLTLVKRGPFDEAIFRGTQTFFRMSEEAKKKSAI